MGAVVGETTSSTASGTVVEGVEVAITGTNAVVEACFVHLHCPDFTLKIVGELLLVGLVAEGVDVEGLIGFSLG